MAKRHDIQQVLRIGDELFRRNGYHDTGTEEILEQASFPRSSFYYHFKNKEGFALKVLGYYGTNMQAAMTAAFNDPGEPSPLERLRNFFLAMIRENVKSEFATSCLIQRFSMDMAQVPGPLQEAALLEFEEWLGLIIPVIQEGQEMGEIRQDFPAEDIARKLFGTMFGEFNLSRLSRNGQDFERMLKMTFAMIST